mgnify:CR=1 FL=1
MIGMFIYERHPEQMQSTRYLETSANMVSQISFSSYPACGINEFLQGFVLKLVKHRLLININFRWLETMEKSLTLDSHQPQRVRFYLLE